MVQCVCVCINLGTSYCLTNLCCSIKKKTHNFISLTFSYVNAVTLTGKALVYISVPNTLQMHYSLDRGKCLCMCSNILTHKNAW